MKHSIMTAALAGALVWSVAGTFPLAAQASGGERGLPPKSRGWPTVIPISREYGGAALISEDVPRVDSGRQRRRRPAQPPPTFSSLYTPSAQAHAKTLGDKDDPTLHCSSNGIRHFEREPFRRWRRRTDHANSQVHNDADETYNGFQIIPFDGRPHRDNVPPSNRGDAVGRWDGDTFVVDKTNFTDTPGSPPKAGCPTIPMPCTSWNAIGAWTRTHSRSRRPWKIPRC